LTEDNVERLVSDSDFAKDLKERTRAALVPILELMDEAARRSMVLGFSVGRNIILGRSIVIAVTINKEL
jgi:hypothetical protein